MSNKGDLWYRAVHDLKGITDQLLRKTTNELTADDSTVEIIDSTSDWNCFQTSDILSRSDSTNSFLAHELDTSPQRHTTLWEIQLELGEILDMYSNNLLKPCQPSPTHTCHSEVKDENEREEEGKEEEGADAQCNETCEDMLLKDDTATGAKEGGSHPVYGMLPCAQEAQGGDYRHDRIDSGVFVHDDQEGYLVERRR